MTRAVLRNALALTIMFVPAVATAAFAQAKPAPAAAAPSRSVQIGGYAMVGRITFAAEQSFDAIVGTSSGTIFGGGARIGLPLGGLFVDIGAWRYHAEGERVFIANGDVVQLGIPVEITVTPLEISAGWQFRLRQAPKLTPYVAGGFTSLGYTETSTFAATTEDVDEQSGGYHLLGGAQYRLTTWIGIAGEFAWTSVPDAIGESGVSDSYDETNLGGTTLRFKVTIGR